MQKINQKYITSIVKQSLREDLRPSGDITTRIIKNKKITAKIIAGQNCIVGGLNFAKKAFKISDKKITFRSKTKDGRRVSKGKVLAVLKGNSSGILKSERVALNFLGLISGVATATSTFVKKVKPLFPNQKNRGTHINISGIGVLKHSPNSQNAIKFIEFLITPKAQKHIVGNTFEYPIIRNVKPSKLIIEMGLDFKQDNSTEVLTYGKWQQKAFKLMQESGWN